MFKNSRFSTVYMLMPALKTNSPKITKIPQIYVEINTRTFNIFQSTFIFTIAIMLITMPKITRASFVNSILSQKFDNEYLQVLSRIYPIHQI